MLTELSPAHRRQLAALHVPVVIVDPVGQPDPRIPSVGAANWAGALTATEHLIELGHRRIGTITGRPALLCSQARVDGYRAALEHAGIPVDPALVCTGDFHFEAALAAATDILILADPRHLRRQRHRGDGGLRGGAAAPAADPHDLSVVGFDDLAMSAWVSPPLTTVAQPLAPMAAMATRMVLQTATDGPSNRVELATSLVIRFCTAAPPPRSAARSPMGAK